MSISMNEDTLDPAAAFLYLVLIVTYINIDWVAMHQNLWKAWRQWGGLGGVVKNTGAVV